MIIGFTQRVRTVSESDAREGEDFLSIDIGVATLRTAEREHPMVFRLQQSTSTAFVEPGNDVRNQNFDTVFGLRLVHEDPVEEEFDLERLVTTIPPLLANIRNDLQPEDEECFTIRIFPVDVPGRRQLFVCNNDDIGAINYFCETTICIQDDDGKYTTTGKSLSQQYFVRSI